jgi:hypothetical protein
MPVDVSPTGSIVVSNLDPASNVIRDAYDEIMSAYLEQEMTDEVFQSYWQTNAPIDANTSLRTLHSLGYWR